MKRTHNIKAAVAGFLATSVLALAATAQAVTLDAGVFAAGNGDAANPIVLSVPSISAGVFLDTINFDLGSFTRFNMTSTASGASSFGSTIFENVGDSEIPKTGGYSGAATSFTNLALPDLGIARDYHLHPFGIVADSASYTLTLWGSNTPGGPTVPIPAAAWLFGSGVIGLVGLARRKMAA